MLHLARHGRALLRAAIVTAAIAASALHASAEPPDSATIAGAMRSVVSVLPQWAGRPASLEEPEGSGVVVGDGTLVLTADHVLGDPVSVLIKTPGGEVVRASVAARDHATDLALLAIEDGLPPMAFGEPLLPGDDVCAIGNAFGLGPSVACGVVSAIRRSGTGFNEIEDFVQTDAAVNPGMSGGALIASDGRLAGVLSAIFAGKSDGNIGVNFAVSAELAAAALDRLTAPERAPWPQLGATVRPAPQRGETGAVGVEVVDIAPDSLAEAAELAVGDVILEAGGRPTAHAEDVAAALALTPDEGTLTFVVMRGGARLVLNTLVVR